MKYEDLTKEEILKKLQNLSKGKKTCITDEPGELIKSLIKKISWRR